ncbi:MAG: tripartite tricarboxylate transporter TctB family protein [Synergistaceae bacterium]|nr:tripartite tricarboxylate transporter TctB family protein [Synergistaceae bacterium]
MTVEFVANIAMFLFFIYAYFFIGATVPASSSRELGAEQWPQGIIILLLVCIGINIFKIYKSNRAADLKMNFDIIGRNIAAFTKSKLLAGILLILALAFLLEPLGFIPACFAFACLYSYLLGSRNYWAILTISLGVVIFLYILFTGFLSVLLPRGTIPFLRGFSLWLESIVQF